MVLWNEHHIENHWKDKTWKANNFSPGKNNEFRYYVSISISFHQKWKVVFLTNFLSIWQLFTFPGFKLYFSELFHKSINSIPDHAGTLNPYHYVLYLVSYLFFIYSITCPYPYAEMPLVKAKFVEIKFIAFCRVFPTYLAFLPLAPAPVLMLIQSYIER